MFLEMSNPNAQYKILLTSITTYDGNLLICGIHVSQNIIGLNKLGRLNCKTFSISSQTLLDKKKRNVAIE